MMLLKIFIKYVNNFGSLRIYFSDRSWHGGFAHEDCSAKDARIPGRDTQAFV